MKLISGHPMLAPAAIDAVKQWRYRPYEKDGEPGDIETRVQINFKLTDNPPGKVRVAPQIAANRLMKTSSTPSYPPSAKAQHIHGAVVLEGEYRQAG